MDVSETNGFEVDLDSEAVLSCVVTTSKLIKCFDFFFNTFFKYFFQNYRLNTWM